MSQKIWNDFRWIDLCLESCVDKSLIVENFECKNEVMKWNETIFFHHPSFYSHFFTQDCSYYTSMKNSHIKLLHFPRHSISALSDHCSPSKPSEPTEETLHIQTFCIWTILRADKEKF